MLALLPLELLVHQDSMVAVTAVEAAVELLIVVVLAVLVEMAVSPEGEEVAVVWVKVLEQLAVLAVLEEEEKYVYG